MSGFFDPAPVIGVTMSARSAWRIWPAFWWALRRAGARPRRITAARPVRMAALDALVIGGGDDIEVSLYGGELRPNVRFDPERDALERDLMREADHQRKPVLGVCRGAQMINIVRGGTLHQDIRESFPEARHIRTALPRKTVHFEPESRIATICGPEPTRVNALHTQSVNALGLGLAAVGHDEGGIVQAIEQSGGRLVIGVQWHPELLIFSDRDHALFRALAQAARDRMAQTLEEAPQ